uniref:Purple acid phosphatase n=1 Tax=Panagrolaimus sp. PS1159 TaxID=55785 RepID=A0AC35F618_9BILA
MKSILKFIIFMPLLLLIAADNGPEQVHLSIGRDSSTMVVTWVTMQPAMTPIVKYGTSTLTHGTLVGSGNGMSKKIYQFKSFPKGNNFPLKVCAFGDLGYLNGTSIPYLIQAAQRGDFDMIIHIGDIAYDLHTNNGERGDLYMNELEPLFSLVPYMVIAGNHEDDGKNFSHFQNRFKMPGFDNQFYRWGVFFLN